MKYVTYNLLWLDGVGHQPYHQVAAAGAEFEGGYFSIKGRMFGYLWGSSDETAEAAASLAAWGVKELTPSEATQWSEKALPVNTIIDGPEGQQSIGPATIGSDGRIKRPVTPLVRVSFLDRFIRAI